MKRPGFTLVELLVVFIIIGILAAAMLLASRGSESSAEATAILNDLRIMKSGAYLFIMHSDDFAPVPGVNYALLLGQYMDHGRIINDPPRYSFYVDSPNDIWVVGVRVFASTNKTNAIIEGKASSSKTMPLYGSDDILTPPADLSPASAYKKAHTAVWTKAK
jgi:prepilin-type N-terminal cleavage/methylation domain-containing protein